MSKRAASPPGASMQKRARQMTPPRAPTLDSWLKPDDPQPLLASSPALHHHTSTFIGLSLSFVPPPHVRSPASLAKEAKRVVFELDMVKLFGAELLAEGEGAFQDGQGKAPGKAGRAREPDHRMWAVRTVALVEGKDGTRGEGDYQLLEACDDDGEKYGGDRILKELKEKGAVDVLTIVCRWYGGDNIGPARFTHMGLVTQHSATELLKLVQLRDLRAELERLDTDISAMRATIGPSQASQATPKKDDGMGKYDSIHDVVKLQRLVSARSKTKDHLEKLVGWAALEKAKEAG